MQSRDDATYKLLVFALQGAQHIDQIAPVLQGCAASAPGGESPFRALVDTGIKTGAAKGHVPAAVVDCAIAGLRTAVSDLDIIKAVFGAATSGNSAPALTDLESAETVELRKCAASKGVGGSPKAEAPQVRTGIRAPRPTEDPLSGTPTPAS